MDGLLMCVHREHRTGNCQHCVDEEAARPAMPQLWSDDGDDS